MNYSMKKKRIMSMLVVLTMAMSFILPTTVFAATPVASDAVATVLKGNGVELVKQITVSFDSEIKFDGADFTDANVTVDNGHSFGESTAIVDENDATKLVIKLADDATVEVGDTITFENSVILDKATETDAFNGSVNISGDLTGAEVNFDVPAGVTVTVEGESAPSYYGIGTYSYKAEGEGFEEVEDTFEVTEGDFATPKNIDVSISKLEAIGFTATAVATNVTANYGKADKIVLVFGEAIEAEASAILAQLSIEDYISNAEFDTTKTILTLTIDQTVTPALTNGTKISYAKNSANKTVSGKIMDAVADVEISGNLVGAEDQITASAMTATIVNNDSKPGADAGDKIVLVFNAPIKDSPASITVTTDDGDDLTANVVSGTANTVYEIVLTTETAEDVTDSTTLTYSLIENVALNGTFGTAVAPKVVRALIEDVAGTAKTAGDKINVFFNVPTNKTAGTTENAFTGVLAGATGEWLDNQTLVITLGETAININNKIDLTNLGIKDFYGTKDADADEIELEGSFGVAVQPSLLTLTAISKYGQGAPTAGDEIHLAFNVKMKEDAININDFTFLYGDYGSATTDVTPNARWADYDDSSVIIITLGQGANVVPGTTKITINKELCEESGSKACTNVANRIVNGTFGTSIAPNLINASIVKRSTEVGSQSGDQIVLLFNVPTNAADIINLISVANGDLGNNVEEGVWTNNNTIYTITLGDGASIENGSSITFTNTNGVLKDINNQKATATKTLELKGSFGVEAEEVGISPSIVTATIVKTTTVAGAQAGDQIVFAFNVATNGVDLKNYFISKGIYGSTGLDGGWSNGNTIYTLVLGEGATVTDTNVVEFTVEAGIKDKNGINDAVTLTAGTFIGSFGATITPESVSPALLSATIIKGDGNTNGAAQAGDKVVFAFNMATNKADLFATLGGTVLFGSNAPAQPAWNEDGNIYTVTLGENATITDDTVLTISADAGLKDKQAYSTSAVINNIELIGSFGVEVVPVAPQPELLRVDIIKISADMGAQPGDKLRFIFNINTNEVDDLISKIQQTLDGASIVALGNNASGAWVEKNIYEITLGTDPKMQSGVKLVIPASAGIKDESGTSVAKEYTVNGFNGTFGESIAPEALSAVAFSDDGVDYIEVAFNVAVKRLANGIMIFENNSNFLGTEPYGEWMSDNIYRITLDNDYTITNTSLLHFNDTYKIYSKDGNAEMAAGSTIAVTGELRKPMVTEVYAGKKVVNGDDVTYEAAETITIVFSSKTNGGKIDLSAQSSLLGIGATAKWNDRKTELTITLGANRKISAGNGYILLNGLGITNGFDNNEVVGQYSISAGILPEDELKTDLIRVNAREDNNNYMTVILNAPTNMYGKTLATEFSISDIEANIEATHTFGTGATAKWESASKLVIKLGDDSTFKNEKSVAENATVTFKNLKFANGLGSIKEEAEMVTGSFDGREIKLEGLTAKVEGDYTVATVTLNKQDLDFGKNAENAEDNFDAVITFVIWDKDGKLVTDMNAMNIDVNAVDKIELQSKFTTKAVSKVDVYVTDTYIDAITEGTPAFNVLADTVASSVAAQ